jgi:hypothetical protein
MSQLSKNIEKIDALFDEPVSCEHCWGCQWLIEELDVPFYDLTFDNLLPGDNLVRCQKCNKAPQFGSKPKKKTEEIC